MIKHTYMKPCEYFAAKEVLTAEDRVRQQKMKFLDAATQLQEHGIESTNWVPDVVLQLPENLGGSVSLWTTPSVMFSLVETYYDGPIMEGALIFAEITRWLTDAGLGSHEENGVPKLRTILFCEPLYDVELDQILDQLAHANASHQSRQVK